MITESSAIIKGIKAIADVFGVDYVKEHKNAPISKNINNNILTLSYLFQNNSQRPDLIPNHLGWTVYATVCVDLLTSEAIVIDGIMPNGTKIAKEQK